VAGRGRIEYDVVEPGHIALEQSNELVEGGYFGGAGAGELLAHGRSLTGGNLWSELFKDSAAITLGSSLGIDIHRRKSGDVWHRGRMIGQDDFEHFVEVRRWIRADQKNTQSTVSEADRRGARERGFSDTALSGKKQKWGRSVQRAEVKHH
jgi:hypothetical protein